MRLSARVVPVQVERMDDREYGETTGWSLGPIAPIPRPIKIQPQDAPFSVDSLGLPG